MHFLGPWHLKSRVSEIAFPGYEIVFRLALVRDCFQNPNRDFDTSRDVYYREGKQVPSLLMMKRAQSTGAKTGNLASLLGQAKGLLG